MNDEGDRVNVKKLPLLNILTTFFQLLLTISDDWAINLFMETNLS